MAQTCAALGVYNAFELLVLICITFKRRKGLYFWSLLLATLGIIPYAVGWVLVHFKLTVAYAGMIIDSVGWVLMVTGQSVVLYSRLHLVLHSSTTLRAVLWMIIFNGVVWHISITILVFGSSYSPLQNRRGFNHVFNVLEKVQMTCFCLQEFIISGLYLWKTLDILRTAFGNKRKFLWQLFGINIVIVAMDIALLVVEYKNHFTWEQGLKVVIYSIKLKLEFAVLGELVEFVQSRGCTSSASHAEFRNPGFVELSDNHSKAKVAKSRSSSMPEVLHLENLERRPSYETRTKKLQRQGSGSGNTMVTTRIEIEENSVEEGDDRSTCQLYDDAIHEISREMSRP